MFVMVCYVNFRIFFYNLCFFMGLFLIIYTMRSVDTYQIISGYFGIDFYSILMIILTLWILGLVFMTITLNEVKYKILIFVLVVLVCGFRSMNLLLFYLFFEIRLVPIFIIVVNWGVNIERLNASYYILIYTLLISLPLLFYILELEKNFCRLEFDILIKFSIIEVRLIEYIIYLIAFLIKIPLYFFHV